MADRKISELANNASPNVDNGSVPIIEAATVNNVTTYTQYRATIRNVVAAGIGVASLDSLSDVVAPSPLVNDVLSFQSGAWRPRNEDSLVDGGNF